MSCKQGLTLFLGGFLLSINLYGSVWADGAALGYKTLHFGHFPQAEWMIPQTIAADRLYIRTKMPQAVLQAQLQMDEQTLIHPIGDIQSTSIPTELAQGYQKTYSDIQVFPLSPLKKAQKQIRLRWTLENGRQKTLVLTGKPLQAFLKSLP
jgi:hypothetical protein